MRAKLSFAHRLAARSTTTRPENISLTVETDRSPPRYTMYYYDE